VTPGCARDVRVWVYGKPADLSNREATPALLPRT
jgi:hypothetical protein